MQVLSFHIILFRSFVYALKGRKLNITVEQPNQRS